MRTLSEIPTGTDWKEKLTPEQRALLPGIDDPPPKPRYQRQRPPSERDVDTLALHRSLSDTLRKLHAKLSPDIRGSAEAERLTVREIVEDAILPRPLHMRTSWKQRKQVMKLEEAARRAIACTAPGALSGLPKWKWPEDAMLVDEHGCRRRLNYYDKPAEMLALGRVPDFTHEPTVLAMLPLVRRAWTGYVVDLTFRETGNVDLLVFKPGCAEVFIVDDVPLYEALTLALEAAPEKS